MVEGSRVGLETDVRVKLEVSVSGCRDVSEIVWLETEENSDWVSL